VACHRYQHLNPVTHADSGRRSGSKSAPTTCSGRFAAFAKRANFVSTHSALPLLSILVTAGFAASPRDPAALAAFVFIFIFIFALSLLQRG
jgi:hypothetical protein